MGFFSWIKSVILGTNEVVPTKKYKGDDWNKPITYSYPSVSKKRVVERSVGSTRSGIPAGPVNHIASRPENSSPTYCASNDLLNPLNPLSPISPFSVWHNGEESKDVPNDGYKGDHQGGNDSDRHKPDNCGYHKIDDSSSGGHHGGHHGHSHNHTDNSDSSNHSHHSHSSDHHTSYDSGSSSYDSGSSDSGGSSDCGGGSSD